MANPGDFAYIVKQQADIVRIVGEYVKLRKSGSQNFQGLCPFHQEKSPSFSVHATRQFFHCFGCGVSGDVFAFIQKLENITFPEAVRLVAEKLNIPLPKMTYSSPEEARAGRMRGGLIDIHERACAFFQDQLRKPEGTAAREYLATRGLTPEQIAEFRIGYAPDSGFLLRDALRNQYAEELLRESGLFSWKEREQGPGVRDQGVAARDQGSRENSNAGSGSLAPSPHHPLASLYSKFRNRVMFPIANEQGKVIAFTGRTLSSDDKAGPKYLNSPETPIYSKSRVLFNLDKAKEPIRKLEYAILVEGQMDCISVYNAGFHNVIASSGTAFTELQARLLGRFSKNIVVSFDPDTAGAAAAERSLALLISEDFQIKVLTLESGFDPDLYIRRKGAGAYSEALGHSQKYFDYLMHRAQKQFPYRTPQGKVEAVNWLLPHFQKVPNPVVRSEIANEICSKLTIDNETLRREVRSALIWRKISRVEDEKESTITSSEKVLIRALASTLLTNSAASSREGHDSDFQPGRQAHYTLSRERLHAGLAGEQLIDALIVAHEQALDPMSLPLEEGVRSLLASILMNEHEELTPELLENALRSLRKRATARELDELQQRVKALEMKQDLSSRALLAQERLHLKRVTRSLGHSAESRDPGRGNS